MALDPIHPRRFSSLAWTRQMNSDLTEKYRLVAMDMRGPWLVGKTADLKAAEAIRATLPDRVPVAV
jgi:hypothetical protein